MRGVFDSTIGTLNTSLNLRQANLNVINSNIANADTPGYKAKKMDFESAFREALGVDGNSAPLATHPEHIAPSMDEPIHPEIYEDPNDVYSLDGNTVNRTEEMAKLAENQIMYNATIEALKKKIGMLNHAIVSGGGSN